MYVFMYIRIYIHTYLCTYVCALCISCILLYTRTYVGSTILVADGRHDNSNNDDNIRTIITVVVAVAVVTSKTGETTHCGNLCTSSYIQVIVNMS